MYCFEDDDTDEVERNMADIQVRRLPVLNRDKRLVGIVSLGDLAVTDKAAKVGPRWQVSRSRVASTAKLLVCAPD